MNKFILLLTCVVGLATAGVLDVRTLRDRQQTVQGETDVLQRMSRNDLERQKFILEVLQRVQDEPQNEQIIRLGQGLIEDNSCYVNGIDGEMQRIIDLARQNRLLSRRDQYTTMSKEHVRQMSGIYRLLVNSADWETLQRNIATLRVNVNGVLLVNSLVLALRDRDDTQLLIVPAVPEILPELYVDEDVVSRAQNLPTNMLTTSEVQTRRPNLLDLIGLGSRTKPIGHGIGLLDRTQLWMPWREMRNQMTGRRLNGEQQRLDLSGQNKLVIPMERANVRKTGIKLLTEDIGLVSYVQELINTLGLLEGEHVEEVNTRIGGGGGGSSSIMMGHQMLGQGISGSNSQRRMRPSELWNINESSGQRMGLHGMNGEELSERQRQLLRSNIEDRRDVLGMDMQRQRQLNRMQNRLMDLDDTLGLGDENLPTTDIDNDRLLHINRRRLTDVLNQDSTQILGNARNRFMNIVRGGRVSDGRRTMQTLWDHDDDNDDDNNDDDIMNMHIGNFGMRRSQLQELRNRQQKQQQQKQQQQKQQQQYVHNIIESDQQLPTTSVDDERLLHINRRRLTEHTIGTNEQGSMRRIHAIHDGRQVVGLKRDEGISNEELQTVLRQNRRDLSDNEIDHLMQLINDRRQRRINLGQLGGINADLNLPSTDVDNDRLLHINRRHMNDNDDNNNDDDDDNNDQHQEDVNGIRRLNKIKQNRLGRIINDDDNDDDDDEIVQDRHGRRVPRSLNALRMQELTNTNDRSDVRRQRIVEVLLHNLQQLVARINLELISVGMQDVNFNFGKNVNDQHEMAESRLEQTIRQQLDQVQLHGVGGGVQDQQIVDRVIGNVIAGRIGNVGLLDRIRDVVRQQATAHSLTQDQPTIGSQLSNPKMLRVLNSVARIIDDIREEQLGGYERRDLELDSVTINDVRVDKLCTFIDETDLDLVNTLNPSHNIDLEGSGGRLQKQVVARQQRLNHENFNIDLDITSQGNQRVVVRTLLGPKTDMLGREESLNIRRQHFIVLDTIIADLRTGRNRITRNSRDIIWTARDTTPYTEIYQRVMSGIHGDIGRAGGVSSLSSTHAVGVTTGQTGRLPERLLLPRGRVNGLPMQLLVIVTPAEGNVRMPHNIEAIDNHLIGMGISMEHIDQLPLGFPLDRQIINERELIDLPNVKLQDVVIQHEN